MANIPKKITDRLVAGVKRFQPILLSAKNRDVNESDTAMIITDMLAEIFGYDKYSEITREFAIRGTYCDLAVKIGSGVSFLIEVKAVGQDAKEAYIKQAIDYAANQGIEWVILTTGVLWKIYKVIFGKPIQQELIAEFDFLTIDTKKEEHLDLLYLVSREGWTKSAIVDYHSQKQALSRFYIVAATLSSSVLDSIRKELRKISPDVKIDSQQVTNVLLQEVIKREILESEKFTEAQKRLARVAAKLEKAKAAAKATPGDIPETPVETVVSDTGNGSVAQ